MLRWFRLALLGLLGLGGLGLLGPLSLPEEAPTPPPRPREHTLLFVGDIMLSRGVGAKMQALDDWTYPFEKLEDLLRSADLTFGNLECPVSDRGRDLGHLYSFRADPRALAGLKRAGFTIVSQANNHTYDWGLGSLVDSLARLRSEGIRPVGAGQNDLEAHYPVIVNLEGLKIGFLAYDEISPEDAVAEVDRPGVAWLEPARVLTDIYFARPLVDLLIVCPHWGVEYARKPTPEQRELARQIIDAGADLIVGGHPHVIQPLEQYHGHWIAYSLGNFIFDQKNPATHRGLMLKVSVRGRAIADLTTLPIHINAGFQPELDLPKGPRPRLAQATARKIPAAAQ